MTKLFKCLICDNFTTRRYLGQYVHQTCFDYMVPIVVKKFGVHNYVEVIKILLIMRNLQDGFLNVELSEENPEKICEPSYILNPN